MKKLVLAVLFSGAAFTAYANPAKDTKKQEAAFKALDKDGDGSVTETEATDGKLKKEDFKKADANGDGKVTLDEYEKAHK